MSATGTAWREQIDGDEAARFAGYAAELRALQRRNGKAGKAQRGLHAKAHLGAVGTMRVVPDLPPELQVGVFASSDGAPPTWPLYARYSNGAPRTQHDGAADVRGLAVKLVGVPGKKVIAALADAKTQDFLFIPTPAIPFRTPDEFVSFVRAAAKGGPPMLIVRLLAAFGVARGLEILKRLAASPKVTSFEGTPLYTAAPLRFGDRAAKLALFPVAASGDAGARPPSASGGAHALREELVHTLAARAIEYSVRVQLFVDDATTPIEDASVVWDEGKAPWREVARLTLPRQDVASPAGERVEALVESLSFDPWHAVEAHRPLGAVMRARAHAYRESVLERGAAAEPEDVLAPAGAASA